MKTILKLACLTLPALIISSNHLVAAAADDGPESFAPRDMIGFAMLMLESGRFDVAEKVANDGLSAHPSSPGFHLVLAEALRGEKKHADAFYEYQLEIISEGPDSPTGDAAARRGAEVLQEKSADGREAVRVMQAVSLMESDPAAAAVELAAVEKARGKRIALELFRAEALEKAGDTAASALVYESVLAHSPNLVPAMVELALLRDAQGDHAAAKDLQARAKKTNPRSWRLR